MNDDAEIRRENLRRTGLKPAEFVERAGRTVSFYADLLREGSKKSFGEKVARDLEQALRLPDRALDQPPEGRAKRGKREQSPNQGELPFLYEITVPPLVPWEWLLKTENVPRMFVVKMPDGSLSGEVEEGDELVFDSSKAPQVGRPVVLETADGRRFIRRYAEGRGEHWRALATSDAYLSFDSSAEEIKVLAALRWRT